MNVAYAHQGALHAVHSADVSLLWAWSLDPTIVVPLAIALLYFRGYRRYRRRGGRAFPRWRAGLFALGITVVVLALVSPIDFLADASFTWHMVQHDLTVLLGIPLILLGAPFIPVVRGLPAVWRRRLFIPVARNGPVRWTIRTLTQPLVGFAAYEGAMVLWHVPGAYDTALFDDFVHLGMHLTFIGGGILFWWNIVTPYPFRSRLHPFLRILMLFASAIINGSISAMIIFSDAVLYGYHFLPGFWGITMKDDQDLGSGLMWVMGDMLRLGAITILFAVFATQESAKEPHARAARAARERARRNSPARA